MLHRNITMLLGWQGVALSSKLSQTTTDAETSIARFDHIVDVAILGSLIWVGEELVVLVLLLCDEGLYILTSLQQSLLKAMRSSGQYEAA